MVYKTAVQAGFYSDWTGASHATDRTLLARLLGAGARVSRACPLSPEELERLGRYRAAVAAGHYTDDVECTPARQ